MVRGSTKKGKIWIEVLKFEGHADLSWSGQFPISLTDFVAGGYPKRGCRTSWSDLPTRGRSPRGANKIWGKIMGEEWQQHGETNMEHPSLPQKVMEHDENWWGTLHWLAEGTNMKYVAKSRNVIIYTVFFLFSKHCNMPCKWPEGMISQWACQAAGVVTLRTLDRTPFASRWRADLSACCVLRFLSSTPVLSRWNRITGQRWSQVEQELFILGPYSKSMKILCYEGE